MEHSEVLQQDFAVAMGPRQITAVLLLALTVTGILCCLSYIIGRAVPHTVTAAAPPPVRPAATASKAAVPCPAALVPPAAKPAGDSGWKNTDPQPGVAYLQLMSVEPGVAEVVAKGLHDDGFRALVAPGSGAGVRRVLVWPGDGESLNGVRARLEAQGLHPFQRTWSEPEEAAPSTRPEPAPSAGPDPSAPPAVSAAPNPPPAK